MVSHVQPVLAFARTLWRGCLNAGDHALDATAGNGHDSLYLAELVGDAGRVWAFDIQTAALNATRARLQQHGCLARVRLVADNHRQLADHVPPGLAVAAFNFGYLPGGDKQITTQADSSVAALHAALGLLRPHGLITAVLYPGHAAGATEADAVLAWARSLPQQRYAVLRYGFENQRNRPPFLLAVEALAQ